MLKEVLKNARSVVAAGLKRPPHEYLYLDRRAVDEHCQALTGVTRIPARLTQSISASAGIGFLDWLKFGGAATFESGAELSHYHLFESLEPLMRGYPAVTDEASLAASIGRFAWMSGNLSWIHMGVPQPNDGSQTARTFHTLETAGTTLMLACDAGSFSPFVPFMVKDTELHMLQFPVEVLGFNPGVLAKYGESVHPASGRSLVIVPTVVIVDDPRSSEARAAWIRERNSGKLSRAYRDWIPVSDEERRRT